MEIVLLTIAGAVTGVALSLVQVLLDKALRRRRRAEAGAQVLATPEELRQARIDRLTRSLMDAELLLGEIASEIRYGQRKAEELEAELAQKEALAQLTAAQTEAVGAVLAAQLDAGERRTFRKQFALNLAFFVAGVLVTVVTVVAS